MSGLSRRHILAAPVAIGAAASAETGDVVTRVQQITMGLTDAELMRLGYREDALRYVWPKGATNQPRTESLQ